MTTQTRSIETSKAMLQALVAALREEGLVTYGRIARDTAVRSGGKVPHALGVGGRLDRINLALHRAGRRQGLSVPPISAIVVSKAHGRPGGGLGPQIARWAREEPGWSAARLTLLEMHAMSREAWQAACIAVHRFPDWVGLMASVTEEDWAAAHAPRTRRPRRTGGRVVAAPRVSPAWDGLGRPL